MDRRTEPEPLAKAIAQIVAIRGLANQGGDAQVRRAWNNAVGSEIAAMTRVLRLHRGVLEIGVTNTALLNQLDGFEKRTLTETMQRTEAAGVRELRFVLHRKAS